MLETEYKSGNGEGGEGPPTSEEALRLCVRVLHKTMTMSKLTADKVEIAKMWRKDGRTYLSLVPQKEVEVLLAELEANEAKKESERKGTAP